MQLEKTIALRMTNEDQETLKQLANNKGMMFGSYCRYILVEHINEEKFLERYAKLDTIK